MTVTSDDPLDLLRSAPLESVLRAPSLFGLTTASPIQRAFCRIADGVPLGELATPDVLSAVGDVSGLAGIKPAELLFIAGVRTGKSLIASLLAVYASQHVDVSKLRPGEIPRIAIVSVTKDLADVVYGHLRGAVLRSPILRRLLVGDAKAQSLRLRHPSGKVIEIKVSAGARAGASLVARWMAGAIFDEAPRMQGADSATVNLDDAREALQGRMLPGAQIVSIGSPWAPFGPIYELVRDHWKHPTKDLVVFKAPAPLVNPSVWTPEACEDERRRDPDGYQSNVLAEFRQADTSLFGSELDLCTRTTPDVELWDEHGKPIGVHGIPYDKALQYVAAIDPATRGNSWTLVILTKDRGVRKVVLAKEWRGSRTQPLRGRDVFIQIAKLLKPYHLTRVVSDQYGGDFIRDAAHDSGLYVYQSTLQQDDKTERWLRIQSDMLHGKFSVPSDPVFISDLRRLEKRTTQQGLNIHLPQTTDGRHCDYAAALVLAASQYLPDRDIPPTQEELWEKEHKRMREGASIPRQVGRGGFIYGIQRGRR